MPNQYGEFTADDGWRILNAVRGMNRDSLAREQMMLERQRWEEQDRRALERHNMSKETHDMNMTMGGQRMKMNEKSMRNSDQAYEHNAERHKWAGESHGMEMKLKQHHLLQEGMTTDEMKRRYEDVLEAENIYNDAMRGFDGTNIPDNMLHPRGLAETRASKMFMESYKQTEAGQQLKQSQINAWTDNYNKNVAPALRRGLSRLDAGDVDGYATELSNATFHMNNPYQYKYEDGQFVEYFRSNKSGGFDPTGRTYSLEEGKQLGEKLLKGEAYDKAGVRYNPIYSSQMGVGAEATKQGNELALYDTKSHMRAKFKGREVRLIPQNAVANGSVPTHYLMADPQTGEYIKGFGLDSPHTLTELNEAGVRASHGGGRKGMDENQWSQRVMELAKETNSQGVEYINTSKASYIANFGNDIFSAAQRFDEAQKQFEQEYMDMDEGNAPSMSQVRQLSSQKALQLLTSQGQRQQPQGGGLGDSMGTATPNPNKAPQQENTDKQAYIQGAVQSPKAKPQEWEQQFQKEIGMSPKELGLGAPDTWNIAEETGANGEPIHVLTLPDGRRTTISPQLASLQRESKISRAYDSIKGGIGDAVDVFMKGGAARKKRDSSKKKSTGRE